MGNPVSVEDCRPCTRNGFEQDGGDPSELPESDVQNARLLRSAREGDPALLREALDAGANLETRQPLRSVAGTRPSRAPFTVRSETALGLTPLMHAARCGHLTCVMALIDSRAHVDAEDECGVTPLHFAASSGDLDVFKALALAGANLSVKDAEDRGPLDYLPEKFRGLPGEVERWQAILLQELPGGL
mmetsp:Transcript_47982/g.102873  ORF Transcript_47982/g.102873 Transcript_47982/m.102873 type:complete len:188 (+) Transcript_47982:56-619(+)